MNARRLQAFIDQTPIGLLEESNGLWRFQYQPDWVRHPQGFALSPHLPLTTEPLIDGASQRPVQWYFDNLLPEEGQRQLLARDAQLEAADAFGLLSWYGAESAGSVTLLPPGTPPSSAARLHPLADQALHTRIQGLPRISLAHGARKRMSLAGAQHKLAVVLKDGALYEPEGAAASTHILKPDHPEADYPHSVINEWFVMRLAGRLGLTVPAVHRRYVPAPVYLIERFDRLQVAHDTKRCHVIDGCQLLGLDRSFKYQQGSIETLAVLAKACRSPAVARTRLFSWLVFNILVGNSDAHLKNLSFLVSASGIQLAPLYDLLSVVCYETRVFDKNAWPQHSELAWPIGNARSFANITRDGLLEAGKILGLNRTTAARLLMELRDNILPAAQTLYAEVEQENAKLISMRPGLEITFAAETRCLRGIHHVVIRDMVAQLV